MGKGIYPAVTYILLFSVGIAFSAMLYTFTTSAMGEKAAALEEVRAERICSYIERLSLMESDASVEIDVGDFLLESGPLSVTGKERHFCPGNVASEGFCRGRCLVNTYSTSDGGTKYIVLRGM
ncbi:MAG: hypothetical protein JW727_04235 [Candidatus Aenigmarchaeota archaeon]|nr:hypothetical protein [Candidatus Aenigmarchaeota archaeon]